ncbi:hypothetical protein CY34DRAFT_96052, partial [Suillus luteus UH-Slu-Lm8-n1]
EKTGTWYKDNKVMIQHVQVWSNLLPLFTCYRVSQDFHFHLCLSLWLQSNGHPPTRSWFTCRSH